MPPIRMTGGRRIELSPYAKQHWTPDDTRAAARVMQPGERLEVVGKFPRGPWLFIFSRGLRVRGTTFAEALEQVAEPFEVGPMNTAGGHEHWGDS